MPASRVLLSLFPIVLTVLGAGVVAGQNYPSKPIRIVTTEVGGAGDFASRLIAQGISRPLGQRVIVENRGGGGVIAGETVAKAPPDGYTLLLYGSSIWLLPFMRENVPWNPLTDFSTSA